MQKASAPNFPTLPLKLQHKFEELSDPPWKSMLASIDNWFWSVSDHCIDINIEYHTQARGVASARGCFIVAATPRWLAGDVNWYIGHSEAWSSIRVRTKDSSIHFHYIHQTVEGMRFLHIQMEVFVFSLLFLLSLKRIFYV